MIRLVLLCCLCLVLHTSCVEQYNIAGNSSVACLDGRMLYLQVTHDGTIQNRVDSCKVIHGRFAFNGEIDSIIFAQLYMGSQSVMPVVLENGNVNVLVENASQRVKGSPLNNKLYKFLQQRERIENDIWQLEQQCMRMMREGRSPVEIREELLPKTARLTKKMENIEVKFVKDNYKNALGPGFFMLLCNQYPFPIVTDQIRRIVNDAPEQFMQHPYVSNYLLQAGYFKRK